MRFSLLLAVSFSCKIIFAQAVIVQDPIEQATYKYLESLTKAEYKALFRKEHPRVPTNAKGSPYLKDATQSINEPNVKKSANTFKSDARFPAEFEEIQGVFISWPYNLGVIDVVSNSDYANIHGKLAEAIQMGNAKVYINVYPAADSVKVKTFMTNKGYQLTNYVFLVEQLDDVWARDFGPIDYYYGANDSIGWIDVKYYPGRDKDNLLPVKWGKKLGYPVQTSKLAFEGGNVLMDGRGKMTTTSMSLERNLLDNAWNDIKTKDSLNHFFNLNKLDIMTLLPHDGGTGHIDLYIDMMDENTYVFAKFPEQMKSIPQFQDYVIATKNLDTLISRKAIDNKPYKFRYMPLPPKDNGSWYTSGGDYDNYTRTYVNHLIVNKTIIQPIFHDNIDGYVKADDEAINIIKKNYPGYTIYPIDMRPYDGSGGSIHCITKELHAENPINIQHYAYTDTMDWQGNFPFDVQIKNKSGISNASIQYRRKGETTFKSAVLTNTGAELFNANLFFGSGETIEYYITATSNNGKTMTKPITADQGGYYTFKINGSVGIQSINTSSFGNIYPNPSREIASVDFTLGEVADIEAQIINNQGQISKAIQYKNVSGKNTLQLNLAELATGFYICRVLIDSKIAYTNKLIKGN